MALARELIARLPQASGGGMSDPLPARSAPPASAAASPRCSARCSSEAPVRGGAGTARGGVQMIPVAGIEPHPGQPRRIFHEEALAELAASIQARGVIQPIVVRPHGHRFQIVAGERRWRAAQRARLHEIPAIVRDFSDEETLEVALLENIQRQDLNAIEEAQAYQAPGRRLWPHPGRARQARPQIAQPCRQPVEIARSSGEGPGHGRDRRAQHGPCPRAGRAPSDPGGARRGGGPPRPVGARDREAGPRRQGRRASASRPIEYKGASADIAALERQLGDLLGLKVAIKHSPKGGQVDARLIRASTSST